MRLSFIPAYYENIFDVMRQTIRSVMTTHNHIESVKNSLILANCIWMALHHCSKYEIQQYYCSKCYYTEDELEQLYYKWCQFEWEELLTKDPSEMSKASLYVNYAVPYAIKCFLETDSYEECMRKILSYYGDTDTVCAIVGPLCVAYYGTTGMDNEKILREHKVPMVYYKDQTFKVKTKTEEKKTILQLDTKA